MSLHAEHPEPVPEPTAPAEAPPPTRREKPKVSPARNAIALVVLVILLIVGGLELSALFRFNGAVGRLDRALEASPDDLLARDRVEELLGRQPEAPLVGDPSGQQATYTWRGALRSHVLTAHYSHGSSPGLVRYEIGPAEAPEPGE